MKPLNLTLYLIFALINTFGVAKESQATPKNTYSAPELQRFNKNEVKSPKLISKDNEFLTKKLDVKLNPVNITLTSDQSNITKSSSGISDSEFKSTFKDSSSTYTSNYGFSTRSPDESLKYCTSKACLE